VGFCRVFRRQAGLPKRYHRRSTGWEDADICGVSAILAMKNLWWFLRASLNGFESDLCMGS